jgi:hypothetical protein
LWWTATQTLIRLELSFFVSFLNGFLMPSVTIKVLDGMEQGRVYSHLPLPVTVGREEDNSIQLNDDRISRFHIKLQNDSGRVILTDLGSTNGTRVNGHPVQMKVMKAGDVISVGRCSLWLTEQTASEPVTEDRHDPFRTKCIEEYHAEQQFDLPLNDSDLAFIVGADHSAEGPKLFPNGRPELPEKLNALQRVQLSDLMAFLHERIGSVVKQAVEDVDSTTERTIQLDWEAWLQLVYLHAELADCITNINNPEA